METKDLQGKLVAVVGYGKEGKAVTNYLIKHGIKPVLFDQKPWEQWPKEEQEQIKKLEVNFIFGPGYLEELKGFDVAFRSPGIKLSELTTYNLQLTSQTKWFFEHCPAKIVGVTGTKGKGTTCALIYEMLKRSQPIHRLLKNDFKQPINGLTTGPSIHLTGNIGYTQPLEILDSLTDQDWVVYELSSFQLQDLEQSPHIGVVLMTTSEHLDYHADEKEYLEAKTAIVKYQTADDFAVINTDYPNSLKVGEQTKAKKFYFSREKILQEGCFVQDDQIVIKLAGNNIQYPISNIQLRGRHNWENVCAAVLAAKCAGCSDEAIKLVLSNFKGLEHRLELVAEKGGIKFYNDSFSTTPETAIAAIQAFTEPEIVILGGSSKNSDFAELGKAILSATNIKVLILIGDEAARIKQSITNFNGQVFEGAKSMPEIFGQIKSVAKKGDVVLLSPACASFDQFANYQDRGEQFKNFAQNFKQ